MNQTTIQLGLPAASVDEAVALYDQAFASKMRLAIVNDQDRRALIKATVNRDEAFTAFEGKELLGLVALKSTQAAFTEDIEFREIVRLLGWWRSLRAAAVLSLYETTVQPGELWIDAIAVSAKARGKGIGSGLIEQVKAHARKNGFAQVKLGVIDTNPRAQKLYQNHGFEVDKVERFDWLRKLLGFGAAYEMSCPVK